jgi:hypothetical protein
MMGNRNSRNDTSSGVKSKRYRLLRGHHFVHTAIDGHSRPAIVSCWPMNVKKPLRRFGSALTRGSPHRASRFEKC